MKRNGTLKLSIIVPVYNVEKYLEQCVDSLLHQDIDKSEYEVILINDGSTDTSYEIAQQLKNSHKNIVLLSQENKGQSVARNRGLDIAKGKYVMFVDSDDGLFPNVIGKVLSVAEENKLDVCAYRIKYADENGIVHLGSIQPFSPNDVYDGKYAITHGADIGAVWLNMYLREMLDKYHLRFLEGIYHEDVDFNLRMYSYANRMMFTDIVAYSYRYVEGSSTRKPNKAREIKLIGDDFCVVRHIRDFSLQDEHGIKLKDFYHRHGNSIVISKLLGLIKNDLLNKEEKLQLLAKLKELNLYPIKGGTLSWKTTILIPLLNMECILRSRF